MCSVVQAGVQDQAMIQFMMDCGAPKLLPVANVVRTVLLVTSRRRCQMAMTRVSGFSAGTKPPAMRSSRTRELGSHSGWKTTNGPGRRQHGGRICRVTMPMTEDSPMFRRGQAMTLTPKLAPKGERQTMLWPACAPQCRCVGVFAQC